MAEYKTCQNNYWVKESEAFPTKVSLVSVKVNSLCHTHSFVDDYWILTQQRDSVPYVLKRLVIIWRANCHFSTAMRHAIVILSEFYESEKSINLRNAK